LLQQSIDISCSPGPQQQNYGSGLDAVGLLACAWTYNWTDSQKDGHRTVLLTLLRIVCGQTRKYVARPSVKPIRAFAKRASHRSRYIQKPPKEFTPSDFDLADKREETEAKQLSKWGY